MIRLMPRLKMKITNDQYIINQICDNDNEFNYTKVIKDWININYGSSLQARNHILSAFLLYEMPDIITEESILLLVTLHYITPDNSLEYLHGVPK